MAEFLMMPAATPTMEVGVVAKWVVAEGTAIEPGTAVAQIETDKATMDVEVFDKCFMLKHLAKEGEEVPKGRPIAILGPKADDDVSALLAQFAAMPAGAPADATPAVAAPVAAAPVAAAPVAAAPVAPAPVAPTPVAAAPVAPAPVAAAPAPRPAAPGRSEPPRWQGAVIDSAIMEPRGTFAPPQARLVASPLARAIAADKAVDLRRVRGSGPDGRIVAADVEAAAAAPSGAPAWQRPADTTRRITQMRKTIARRLTEVHQQVPVFYLTVTFDMTACVALKEQGAARGLKFSYNDILLRAVAQALRDVPSANAAWTAEGIVERGGVDIGVAVALPEGLITPVVRDVDRKSITAIAEEVRALAGRAKAGTLAPEEYTGSTFTISNLGMFGIEHFTAILNPPEAGILAVGGVQEVPVAKNGRLEVGWRMKVTMTCDHRVIDGALGARFLAALRAYIECPALLVLA